jgi:AcrR family transcriptional regulator
MELRRDDRAERKRSDVLTAARRRFMVEGYASTGMEAVARDAQISTATLYAHFPSKADLFQAVVEEAGREFSARLEEAVGYDGDSAQQLRKFTLAYASFMGDPFVKSLFRLVAAERRRFDGVARAFYDQARDLIGARLIDLLERMEAEGALKLDKPSWAAGQLMGMIDHPVFVDPLLTDRDGPARPLEQICDQALSTFLARYAASTQPVMAPAFPRTHALQG